MRGKLCNYLYGIHDCADMSACVNTACMILKTSACVSGKLCVSQYGTHDCEYMSACVNTVCAYVSSCVSGKMRIQECVYLATRFEGAPMGLQRVAAVVFPDKRASNNKNKRVWEEKIA